jgi:hypothetical protein
MIFDGVIERPANRKSAGFLIWDVDGALSKADTKRDKSDIHSSLNKNFNKT